MIRGRIEKALSGFYYVNTGAETLQCRARGKFRREGLSPLVGDWVQVRELGGGEGFVEAVEPRRNAFDRPAAANIDQLVIIASAALPVTDPYLIDRISAIAALKDCRVLLCLNKCDLDPAEELYGIYSGSAIRVLRVSAVTGQGIDELRRELGSPAFSTPWTPVFPWRWGRSARPWAGDGTPPAMWSCSPWDRTPMSSTPRALRPLIPRSWTWS